MIVPFIELEALFRGDRPAHTVVARGIEGDIHFGDFVAHVGGLSRELIKSSIPLWVLGCQSSYSFLVGLMAGWTSGVELIVPPNTQSGTLQNLFTSKMGLITDFLNSGTEGVVILHPTRTSGATEPRYLPMNRAFLRLHTSGSTGECKVVLKTGAQLGNEVAALEKVFGADVGRSSVVSTVSHQHIYGLLFRVLWPLCAGRAFSTSTFLFWDQLRQWETSTSSLALVTSPSHLERIPSDIFLSGVSAIFSSGGELKDSVAQQVRRAGGVATIEVFGSTETGGVGWRRHGEENGVSWTPLPGVNVKEMEAERLAVRSPYAGSSDEWVLMGDRGCVFPDGRFSVLGRTDRIVKVAEKRVSLDAMEKRLAGHPGVAESYVWVRPGGTNGQRIRIDAAVKLSPSGEHDVLRWGWETMVRFLREHLRKEFEPVVLPRRIRAVTEFPRNLQGKIERAVLEDLFERPFHPEVTRPEISLSRSTASSIHWEGRVPRFLGAFEGHFPGFPVVPGVVQLSWVFMALEDCWKWSGPISRLEAIKFKRLLRPGDPFQLDIRVFGKEETRQVEYNFFTETDSIGSGRIYFKDGSLEV